MVQLLIFEGTAPALPTADTAFGGRPSVGAGFAWPVCRTCEGAMQFLGQVRDGHDHVIALFMCQNDPGMCDEWDAGGGGNRAWRFASGVLTLAEPPASGETLRGIHHGVRVELVDADDYDAARSAWLAQGKAAGRQVLGDIGGEPSWLQSDETPDCDQCGHPMAFVAQLEEGPDHRTAMNFGGGGCAYVFRCTCSQDAAKLLWQS